MEHDGLLVLGGNDQDLRKHLETALGETPGELSATIDIIRRVLGTTNTHVELALLDRAPQELRGTHRAYHRLDPQAF